MDRSTFMIVGSGIENYSYIYGFYSCISIMTFVSIKRLSFFSVRLDSKFISFLFSPYSCYVVKVATNNWLLTFFSFCVSFYRARAHEKKGPLSSHHFSTTKKSRRDVKWENSRYFLFFDSNIFELEEPSKR